MGVSGTIIQKLQDILSKTKFCDPELIASLREGMEPGNLASVYKELFRYIYQSKRLKYISFTILGCLFFVLEFILGV